MNIRYKCLILDHDDTSVDSTASIHYPAHLEIMRQLRPELEVVSLEGWFRKNYNPGVFEYYTDELGFNENELRLEYEIWRQFTGSIVPEFFPGFLELLEEFRCRGGRIAVVSHSDVDIIRKHYQHHVNGSGLEPEIIFGWDENQEKRKPSPYPVLSILEEMNLSKDEVLILDDLKPGVQMAHNSGVSVAAAGWGHQIDEIRDDMEKSCDFYFTEISQFRNFLLG